MGRTVALRALVSSVEALASVLVLNWAGGESTTARSLLQQLSLILRVTFDRAEFEDELFRLAPLARAAIERALPSSSLPRRGRRQKCLAPLAPSIEAIRLAQPVKRAGG